MKRLKWRRFTVAIDANSVERSETEGMQSLDCCPFACAGRGPGFPRLPLGSSAGRTASKQIKRKAPDGACSNPEPYDLSAYFRRALTLCDTHSINWRKQPSSPRQPGSPARFLCSFLLSVRRRRTKDVRFLESPSATRASRRTKDVRFLESPSATRASQRE